MTLLRNILNINLSLLVCLLSANTASGQVFELKEAPINSAQADFGAMQFQNGIVFCSARNGKKVAGNIDSSMVNTDMFLSTIDNKRHFSAPVLFSNELTEKLNEGPATFTRDYKTIYYTANLKPANPAADESYYPLGIFISHYVDGKWTTPQPFPYNSPDHAYDVAHPCLSKNDSIIYFTSNKPGGYGLSDLYYSKWENGKWQEPVNLGEQINTSQSELFPYLNDHGWLYFSSNGHHMNADMDLLFTKKKNDGVWEKPKALPSPLNSEFNDYTYSEFNGEHFGFISSDRNKTDNIYFFSRNIPHFSECLENQRTVLCYTFENSGMETLAQSPLVYEWDLGDGTILRGESVEHCFKHSGTYKIRLHVRDTLTQQSILDVSETILNIEQFEQPYILSLDSAEQNELTHFYVDSSPIQSFEIDQHYWVVDDKHIFVGDSMKFSFSEPGVHTIMCGSMSKPGDNGEIHKSCATKQIRVLANQLDIELKQPDPSIEPILKMDVNKTPRFALSEPQLKPLYRIVLCESNERIPMNHEGFEKVQEEIIETKDSSGTFTYSVGISAELVRLYDHYKALQQKTGKQLKIESFDQRTFNDEYLRTGKYIANGDAEMLNIEFNKLQDIKFEYNSAAIRPESFSNLDYIAAMLALEKDFKLRINAHTCSQGTHDYNVQLSKKRAESVRKYFMQKGISAKRLICTGYAETQPIAENNTEEGKSKNRRVEFIILFNSQINE